MENRLQRSVTVANKTQATAGVKWETSQGAILLQSTNASKQSQNVYGGTNANNYQRGNTQVSQHQRDQRVIQQQPSLQQLVPSKKPAVDFNQYYASMQRPSTSHLQQQQQQNINIPGIPLPGTSSFPLTTNGMISHAASVSSSNNMSQARLMGLIGGLNSGGGLQSREPGSRRVISAVDQQRQAAVFPSEVTAISGTYLSHEQTVLENAPQIQRNLTQIQKKQKLNELLDIKYPVRSPLKKANTKIAQEYTNMVQQSEAPSQYTGVTFAQAPPKNEQSSTKLLRPRTGIANKRSNISKHSPDSLIDKAQGRKYENQNTGMSQGVISSSEGGLQNSQYVLLNTAKTNQNALSLHPQYQGGESQKHLKRNQSLQLSLANRPYKKSSGLLTGAQTGASQVDSSVEFANMLESRIIKQNAHQSSGGVTSSNGPLAMYYDSAITGNNNVHSSTGGLVSYNGSLRDSQKPVVHRLQSKKSFVEEQLQKRIQEVFGITYVRPKTGINHKEIIRQSLKSDSMVLIEDPCKIQDQQQIFQTKHQNNTALTYQQIIDLKHQIAEQQHHHNHQHSESLVMVDEEKLGQSLNQRSQSVVEAAVKNAQQQHNLHRHHPTADSHNIVLLNSQEDIDEDEEEEETKQLRKQLEAETKTLEPYHVKVDLNQEYQKHKKALCLLDTLKDIGFEWDLAFYRIFSNESQDFKPQALKPSSIQNAQIARSRSVSNVKQVYENQSSIRNGLSKKYPQVQSQAELYYQQRYSSVQKSVHYQKPDIFKENLEEQYQESRRSTSAFNKHAKEILSNEYPTPQINAQQQQFTDVLFAESLLNQLIPEETDRTQNMIVQDQNNEQENNESSKNIMEQVIITQPSHRSKSFVSQHSQSKQMQNTEGSLKEATPDEIKRAMKNVQTNQNEILQVSQEECVSNEINALQHQQNESKMKHQSQSVQSHWQKNSMGPQIDDQNLNRDSLLDFRNQNELTLYFEVSDFLMNLMQNKGSYNLTPKSRSVGGKHENNMSRKKDQILAKLRHFICISRDFMEFLKFDQEEVDLFSQFGVKPSKNIHKKSRGMARAFLFDSLLKSLMLIVDDVIVQFEKYAKERVANAVRRVQNDQAQLQAEIDGLKQQINNLKILHLHEVEHVNERLERVTAERNNCLTSIQEYRQEIARLTDPNYRGDIIGEMSDAIGKVSEYISHSEDQRNHQIKMMGDLIKMLDLGTKRNPRLQTDVQTELTLLIPEPSVKGLTMISDKAIEDMKMSQLVKLLSTGNTQQQTAQQKETTPYSNEDVIKQFSYIMAEKVKKDLIDKKQVLSSSSRSAGAGFLGGVPPRNNSSFIDFVCAVTLTNTNSLSASRVQLGNYVAKVSQMARECHPFGEIVARLLGMPLPQRCTFVKLQSSFSVERLPDTVIDYYLHMRNMFVDKVEGGNANTHVTIMQIVDFVRDHFDNNKSLGALILETFHRINTLNNAHKLGFDFIPPLIEFSHLKLPAGSTEQFIKELSLKFAPSFLNKLSFTFMSLILQLDYQNSSCVKSLRPLFEVCDPHREGKLHLDTFRDVLRNNTNGKGLDLWLTDIQVAALIEYLDPAVGDCSHRQDFNFKLDYTTLLYQLEKPLSYQFAKATKIPSLTFYHSLLTALDTFLREVAPVKIEEFLMRNSMSMGFGKLPVPVSVVIPPPILASGTRQKESSTNIGGGGGDFSLAVAKANKPNYQEGATENYEQFIQLVKRLSPNMDSIRISNIYLRYAGNLVKQIEQPFGRAVLEEVENDLLQEAILNNTAVLSENINAINLIGNGGSSNLASPVKG